MQKYKNKPSYKIINHLYDVRKDFIILGLCGKVGSGVSTTTKILEKDFDALQFPHPGFNNPDIKESHKYRILYSFANKNWIPFNKIRTSSLITRHILEYNKDDFYNFLSKIYSGNISRKKLQNIVNNFFESTMSFDLSDYLPNNSNNNSDILIEKMISYDDDLNEINSAIAQINANNECADNEMISKSEMEIKLSDNTVINYTINDEKTISISNEHLSHMIKAFKDRRTEKSGFKNPFWYIMMKQYLYDFLPNSASELWKEISEISKSLSIHALQIMGNNLRSSKTPYFSKYFDKEGYVCVAEDINLAIKVFRGYQLKTSEFNESLQNKNLIIKPKKTHNEERTVIAIDSIKNPYEAMYLKDRYSNFYLIGIYTEDYERKKRLREKKHLTDDDISAVDIIEQNSEFKKAIKEYHYQQKNNESKTTNKLLKKKKSNQPEIIEKIYRQFKSKGLIECLSHISPFISQNVSSCLDSADILINNKTDNNAYAYLKRILLRYVCLIMNPALVVPTDVERCMQIAYTTKPNSGCISRQVGAVVTDENYHLMSIGWNQQPESQLPCSYRDLCELANHWCIDGFSDYENNDSEEFHKCINNQVKKFFDTEKSPLKEMGKLPCYCFKDYYNGIIGERNQVHTRSLHAEETAFLNLGPNNTRITNGILFTTSSPCELCSKKAMYLGIKKIYYVEPYPGVSENHVMSIGPANLRPQLVLFTGAIGTAYSKLYTPLLPRKDENEMILGCKIDNKLPIN